MLHFVSLLLLYGLPWLVLALLRFLWHLARGNTLCCCLLRSAVSVVGTAGLVVAVAFVPVEIVLLLILLYLYLGFLCHLGLLFRYQWIRMNFMLLFLSLQ